MHRPRPATSRTCLRPWRPARLPPHHSSPTQDIATVAPAPTPAPEAPPPATRTHASRAADGGGLLAQPPEPAQAAPQPEQAPPDPAAAGAAARAPAAHRLAPHPTGGRPALAEPAATFRPAASAAAPAAPAPPGPPPSRPHCATAQPSGFPAPQNWSFNAAPSAPAGGARHGYDFSASDTAGAKDSSMQYVSGAHPGADWEARSMPGSPRTPTIPRKPPARATKAPPPCSFRIDRTGRVLSVKLIGSAGGTFPRRCVGGCLARRRGPPLPGGRHRRRG